MKKFGFKKSSQDDDGLDPNRRALFGSRSRDKSPNPQQQSSRGGNPYANNPYAQSAPASDPYTRAKMNAGVIPPPSGPGGPGPYGDVKHPGGPGSYGDVKHPGGPGAAGPVGNQQGGYAPNRYGNQGGYGADRYGGGADNNYNNRPGGGPSRYGPGGYGGLGSSDPNLEEDRAALFGAAPEQAQNRGPGAPPPYSAGGGDGGYGGYGQNNDEPSTAEVYRERQLTAEEEEEEEVNATKQEIRFIKQGDVSSTRNALRVAAQAEETGRNTLARLGAQGERILDTERSLDIASSQGRIAEDKSRELKQLNKSMFAVHVSNPFTSNARRRERDEKILQTHRAERETRDGTRNEQFQANQRMERTFRDIEREATKVTGAPKKDISERAKYQFEADSEDEAMEDEIDNNLHLLSGAAARLNGLARATGKELEEQNRHLERIAGKSDYVDDQIAMNRARLDRIR